MFDIGILEMAVIAVVALLVFGPDRLPGVAKEAGAWLRRARGLLAQARHEVTETIGIDPATDPRRLVSDALLAEDPPTSRPPASGARVDGRTEDPGRRSAAPGSMDDIS